MGQKLDFDDTAKFIHSVPGPGTHNPTFQPTKTKYPNYSMGLKIKQQKDTTSIVPGPGTYVNSSEKLKLKSPSFGFGTSKRPVLTGSTKFMTPGPGHYKVPTRIADVPSFAMPNRN